MGAKDPNHGTTKGAKDARIPMADAQESAQNEDWKRVFGWGSETVGLDDVNHFRLEANSPIYTWVQQAEAVLLAGIGNLEAELINLASVAISGINGCVYCFGAWCTLLEHTKMTDDEKLNSFLKHGAKSPMLTPKERDVITFVLKAQTEPENIEREEIDYLLSEYGFDGADLLNLVHLVDIVSFSNRVNTVFKTPLDERYKATLRKYAGQPEEALNEAFATALAKDLEDRRADGDDY